MFKKLLISFILFVSFGTAGSQNLDSIKTIKLPYITIRDSSFNSGVLRNKLILTMTHRDMKETGGLTLADALKDLPGVTQLHTGPIAKPVLRGLYGNRLQVNLGGLKLEDQQWEDEQGLALSEVGVKGVEVIKGPAAILYGADAIGGVIRVIDDEADSLSTLSSGHKTNQHIGLELFSNTYGMGLDYGLKKRVGQSQQWIFNAAIESHADYSDGQGRRAPNTRFALYNFKSGYNFKKDRWKIENRLYFSFNQFGFIKDTADVKEVEQENRLSRDFEDEHHTILNVVFTNRSVYKINERTDWNSTLGWQSNIRKEQEGEIETELGLSLHTLDLQSSIEKRIHPGLKWITGAASKLQFNSNFGSRIIIPDARSFDIGLFSYFNKKYTVGDFSAILESGIRYDLRNIQAPATENHDDPLHPFPEYDRNFNAFNYSIGGSFKYNFFLLKIDFSTGFRNPNLAEIFSNGRHEGTDRWDAGNLNMKNEFAINKEIYLQYQLHQLTFRGSLFSTHFKNYIFINPTSESYLGFPLYRYTQSDAAFKGYEGGIEWSNQWIILGSLDYSYLNAQRQDGSWLPYTPANRLMGKIKLKLPEVSRSFHNTLCSFRSSFTAAQNHTAANEQTSPAYWLHAFSVATEINQWRLMITCNNLTNTYYNDHLSILRQIGVRDMGRNIVLNVGITF